MAVNYVMISISKSEKYTDLAILTFLKNTNFQKDDLFTVIDNDCTGRYDHHNFQIISNNQPKTFSQNVNMAIDCANDRDIVVLNNDIVFTKDWNCPLVQYKNIITLPSCNQTHLYSSGNLKLSNSMSIEEYTDGYELETLATFHKNNVSGLYERLLMPFYAFSLPKKVYNNIGKFDESFKNGGEDVDYRIRCIKNDIQVKYHSKSYLLHFQGKSSWDGPETASETNYRDKDYTNVFTSKYNEDLAELCLSNGNPFNIIDKYNLKNDISDQNFSLAIQKVIP